MTNEELVQEYQNGSDQALNKLVDQNIGLVIYIANKYQGFGQRASLEFDDLVQEGWIGFVDAAKKYNPNYSLEAEEVEPICLDDSDEEIKTVMFSSYASRAIQNKIIRAINKNIPREKKSDTYSEPIKVNSINALLPGSEDTTLESIITYDNSPLLSHKDIERNIDNEILRKDLLELLDSIFGDEFQYNGHDLNGVENIKALFDKLLDGITAKEVLLLHYGLFGKPMSFTTIAEKVGLSASRIEQIESKGLYAIRNHSLSKDFLKKYKLKYIEELEGRKESMDQFKSADKIISSMEYIDDMLKKYI